VGGARIEHDGGRVTLFSVRDVIAWDAGVRARAILNPESWNLILQPVRLTSGKSYPYGFGWFLEVRNGQPFRHHGGAWQGFKTQFSRFIGEDLSVIVLANLAQAIPTRFADGIAEIMNRNLAAPVLHPIDDREPTVTARLARLLAMHSRESSTRPNLHTSVPGSFRRAQKQSRSSCATWDL